LHTKLRARWPGRAAEGTEYIRQVLSALQYAHSRDIVHRDIKPSNIMITTEGQAKLLDFGIAFKASDKTLTKPGSMVGSLFYMCPEQVRGEQVDARSDLYSLGVTLYEIVTGRRPFDGGTEFEIMAGHLQEVPKWPGDIDPDIPGGLSHALMKALAKNPAERYQSAAEFLEALNHLSNEDRATLHTLSIPPSDLYSRSSLGTPRSHITPAATPAPGARPVTTLDAAVLDSVVRELATFIGPIAKVVVKRAAAGCSSVDDLYSTVSKEIDSDKDRTRFLGSKKPQRLP
jgi:serine/threonine-protein kinase